MGPVEGDRRHELDIAIVVLEQVPWPKDSGDSPDASRDCKNCKE